MLDKQTKKVILLKGLNEILKHKAENAVCCYLNVLIWYIKINGIFFCYLAMKLLFIKMLGWIRQNEKKKRQRNVKYVVI